MLAFITNLEINLIVAAVSLLAGVLFSTKIKDWFKGIPASLRSALNGVEQDTLAKVKAAQAQIVSTLPAPPAADAKVALPPAVELAPAPVTAAPAAPLAPIA